jgi:hypothetical protein
MLTAADKEKLKAMGFDPEHLIKTVTDAKEVALTMPDGKLYSDADIDQLKTNVKNNYSEIFMRNMNKEHGLGLTGSDAKDEAKVLAAFRDKAVSDAKIEPDKRVKELEKSLEKLQNEVVPNLQKEAGDWKGKYTQREEYDFYAGLIPKGATDILTRDEHVNRIKGMYKKNEDGTYTDVKTGNVVKDNLEKPVTDIAAKVAEVYQSNAGWMQAKQEQQQQQQQKGGFHHSTQGGGNTAGKFDQAKTFETISAKYDMTTYEGRKMAQNEFTTAAVNAAKAGV